MKIANNKKSDSIWLLKCLFLDRYLIISSFKFFYGCIALKGQLG